MINSDDLTVEIIVEKPKSGMWHCGPNCCWIILTHIPTMTSVRLYSGGKSQHQARVIAMDMMEYALASTYAEKCMMPEILEERLKGKL